MSSDGRKCRCTGVRRLIFSLSEVSPPLLKLPDALFSGSTVIVDGEPHGLIPEKVKDTGWTQPLS